MSDEIYFDGVRFLRLDEAAQHAGLSVDYVQRLARKELFRVKEIGGKKYIDQGSLSSFLAKRASAKEELSQKLSQERLHEYGVRNARLAVRSQVTDDRFVTVQLASQEAGLSADYIHRLAKDGTIATATVGKQTLLDRNSLHAFLLERAHKAEEKKIRLKKEREAEYAQKKTPSRVTSVIRPTAQPSITSKLKEVSLPVHGVTSWREVVEKTIALTLAVTLTFSVYALIDPSYARFALSSAADSVKGIEASYEAATHGGIQHLAELAQSSLKYTAENPSQSLASAASFFPDKAAALARFVNSGIDRFVYAVAFPNTLTTHSGGSVAVEIAPYAAPATGASPAPAHTPAAPTPALASNSTAQTIINNPVVERIIERAVPGKTVIQAGGITEDYLNTKLNQLENKLSSRMYGLTAANSTTITQNYVVAGLSSRIQNLDDARIGNARITGGTIADTEISGGTIRDSQISAQALTVSGDTTLANATISNDLTVSGNLNILSASSSLSALNASFTNATSTNLVATSATSTNFFATSFVATNATTTNFATTRLSVDSLSLASGITSHFVPAANKTYDLGSPSFYWRNGYIDTITVNNISAASTSIGGTQSNSLTINSDNGTADAEDMSLIFFRGVTVPNAVFSWNSATAAKRFELNQAAYISNLSGSTTQPTLTLKGAAGQTGNIFQIASSSGATLFSVGSDGSLALGTTTLTNLAVTNTSTSSFAGGLTVSGYTSVGSLAASDVHIGNNTLSQSGNYFTVSSQNQNIQLTAGAGQGVYFGTNTEDQTWQILSNSNTFRPGSDNAYDFGGPSNRIANGYFGNSLSVSGNFVALASSTIGNGTQTSGLTVSGGATTTGNAYVAGTVGIGTQPNASYALALGGDATIGANTVYGDSTNPYLRLSNATGAILGYNGTVSRFIVGGSDISYAYNNATRFIAGDSGTKVFSDGGLSVLQSNGTSGGGFNISSPGIDTSYDMAMLQGAYGYSNGGLLGYKSSQNHGSFGARGIKMSYLNGITFFADNQATTLDAAFTPTARMIITNTGNVGIGTTSPTNKLEVAGNAFLGGNLTATGTLAISNGANIAGQTTFDTNFAVIGKNVFDGGGHSDDAGGFRFTDPTGLPRGFVSASNGYAVSIGTNANNFGTQDLSKPGVQMYIDGRGQYGRFDVYTYDAGTGAEHQPLHLTDTNTLDVGNGFNTDDSFASLYVKDNRAYGAKPTMRLDQNGDNSTDIFQWYDGSNNKLGEITGTGSIGIGTTSPSRALSVNGSSDLGTNAYVGYLTVASTTATSTFAGDLRIGPATGLTYGSAGRVVISSTNESVDLLHVNGARQFSNAIRISAGAGTGDWGIRLREVAEGDFAIRDLTNSADRLYINSSGFIGINTTNPTYRLEVAGLGRFTGLVDAANFIATSTTATSTFLGPTMHGGGTVPASSLFTVGTSSTPLFTIDNNSGLLGIGSNAVATVKLSINSNTQIGINNTSSVNQDFLAYRANNSNTAGNAAKTTFQLNNNIANTYLTLVGAGVATSTYIKPNGAYLYNDGSPGLDFIAAAPAGALTFWTGGSNQRAVIDSSGNFGIGTTSPQTLLGIQGGIGVNSSQLYLAANGSVGINSQTTNARFTINGTGANSAHGQLELSNTAVSSNVVDFGISTGNNSLVAGDVLGDLSIASIGSIVLGTGNGGNVKMNNSLTGQLQVFGWSQLDSDPRSGAIFVGSNSSFRGVVQYGANPSSLLSIDNTNDTTAAAIQFRARTSGNSTTTIMTMMGSGNVGIGTTSPATALAVAGNADAAGNIAMFTDASGGDRGVRVKNYGGGRSYLSLDGGDAILRLYNSGSLKYELENLAADNTFRIYSSTDTNQFYLMDGSGGYRFNVGTTSGTTFGLNSFLSMSALATAAGVADFGSGGEQLGFSRTNDGSANNSGMFNYISTTGNNNLGLSARNDMVFLAGGGGIGGSPERMRITSAGNLGIGTTSPSQALSVAGIVYTTGGIRFADGSTQTAAAAAAANGTQGQFAFYAVNGSTLSGTSTLFAATNGNIGIGTTTPGSILAVAGVANFTTATSTFYATGGINITSGCYAIAGSCVSLASGQALAVFATSTVGTTTVQFSGAANSSPSFSNGVLTLPSNTAYATVEVWGAGGGGSGGYNSTGGIPAAGGNGGTTCFGTSATACASPTLSATGGLGGIPANINGPGGTAGGTGSGGDVNLTGSPGHAGAGDPGSGFTNAGSDGGSAANGGGGGAGGGLNTNGTGGAVFGGGGGAGGGAAGGNGGAGGGGGGYSSKLITGLVSSYTFTITAGGSGGNSGGGSSGAGAAGAPGGIVIKIFSTSNGTPLSSGQSKAPTESVLTSGSGTYTVPAGVSYIKVRMVGGGGGGSGSGSGAGNGGAGGNTTFGSSFLTAGGGGGGQANTNVPPSGGTASGGDINLVGATSPGGASGSGGVAGYNGGSSPFGGAGAGGGTGPNSGGNGQANTGSGGGGAGSNGTINTGGGGAAGGYVEKLVVSPSSSYSYAVGGAGSAGSAGGGSAPGGTGGSGVIIIDEYYGSASSGIIGSGIAGQFAFYNATGATLSATSTLFLNTSNSFLGVGTTSPRFQFEMVNDNGGTGIANAINAVTQYGNDAAGPTFLGTKARGTAFAPLAVQANDDLAAFTGRGFDGTNFSGGNIAAMKFTAAGTFTPTSQPTYITFGTTPTTTTTRVERLRIDSTGNVGIGTTTPQSLLTLSATPGASGTDLLQINSNGSTNVGSLLVKNSGAGGLQTRLGVGSGTAYLSSSGSLNFYTSDSGTPNTPNGFAMTINSTGNVGIGTTSPTALLSVQGGSGDNATFNLINNPGNNWKLWNDNGASALNIQYNGSTKLAVLNTGVVGIGVTSVINANDLLSIEKDQNATTSVTIRNNNGSASAVSTLLLGNNSDAQDGLIQLNGSGNTSYGGARSLNIIANCGDLTLGTNRGTSNNQVFTIKGQCNTGANNVGIGTSTPSAVLSIAGSGTTVPRLALDTGGTQNAPMIRFGKNGANEFKILVDGVGVNDALFFDDADGSNGVYLAQNATGWTGYSDRRLKENIATTTVLDKLDSFRAVSFNWKANGVADVGVIAQELYKSFPQIVQRGSDGDIVGTDIHQQGIWGVQYDKLGVFALEGVKELNIKVDALTGGLIAGEGDIAPLSATSTVAELTSASSTIATSTPWVASFADASQSLKNELLALGDVVIHIVAKTMYASTGIFEKVFAQEIHTDKICVSKSDGTEFCANGDELAAIAASAAQGSGSGSSNNGSSSNGGGATSTPDTESPVISIIGANPASINVGDTYSDLGATVTDNVSTNLGISVSVDGGATTTIDSINIETSSIGTHSILYSATDEAGNVGFATRTVNVINLAP